MSSCFVFVFLSISTVCVPSPILTVQFNISFLCFVLLTDTQLD